MTASESSIITQKAGKILAVDSDPEVIRILGVNLTHANLEFVSAQSGVEAIDKTFSERPDIILLGPPLPDIDVKDIYQQLQRSPQTNQIPIIVISSTKSKPIVTNEAENGSIHYITRPFDPNEIVNLVQTHLRQKKSIQNIREKLDELSLIIEGLTYLTRVKRLTADAIFEEVDITDTLDWVINQIRDTLKQHDIKINIHVADKLGPISIDRRTLTECLVYIVRNEIQLLPSKGHLEIRGAEMNEEFLTILIINPSHHTPQNETGRINLDELKNSIYPAKLMLQGLGQKLNVTSEKEEGTTYTLIIPKRWHSWMQETSSLQQATEISRKEAQSELVNIRHLLSSLSEQVPPAMKDSLDKIRGRIQELGVLCNRTLFLTEDLNS